MKSIVTNKALLDLHNDIQKQVSASIAFHVFNQVKISTFYQRNKVHLDVLHQKIDRLVKKHVAHDEAIKPIVADGEYTFDNDEDKKNYINEFNNLMQANCTMFT